MTTTCSHKAKGKGKKSRHPWVGYHFNPHEFALCGPSGAGKTTLACRLIAGLSQAYQTAYVKHASHGFTMDKPGKDSQRAAEHGADAVYVHGAGRTACLTATEPEKYDWPMSLVESDVVVVEGFKDSTMPKLVVVANDGDVAAVNDGAFECVWLVVGAGPERPAALREDIPYACRDAIDEIQALVVQRLRDQVKHAGLHGLVLTGGASQRMSRDKAALTYHGKTQTAQCVELLAPYCEQVYVSCRTDQADHADRAPYPQLHDRFVGMGPMGGILSAMVTEPQRAWLVLACDLPFVDAATLANLLEQRNPFAAATAYQSRHDGLPEPLCAVYEPKCRHRLLHFLGLGYRCPRKVLINSRVKLLDLVRPEALDNVNDPDEYADAQARLNLSGTT